MKSVITYLKRGGILFVLLAIALVLNHRMGYITLIGLFSILVYAKITIKSGVDRGDMVILLYTVIYIILSSVNGFTYSASTLVLYSIAPFIFYQFGKELVKRFKTGNYIIIAWLIIVLCYCLDIFIVIANNIIETGQIINASRVFSFDEDGESRLSATLVGLSMDIGMIGFPMFLITKNKLIRCSFFLLFLFSLITTFSLLNRTGIIVALLCFFIVIGYRARKDFKSLILYVIIIGLFFWILSYIGIINTELIEFYNERNKDLATMGSRSERWSKALGNLFLYPVGWADYGDVYYVHNMWLDVARISGILPFLLLAYMAFDAFRTAFRLIRKHEDEVSYMILGLNVCFFASCFVEPIYGGTHFILYCMLWGTSNALLKRS